MRNKMCVYVKSFTYMKQQILERLGYSDRIERMFGRGKRNLGYKVYVGQLLKSEIDFVAEKADSIVYVQVTYLLASEDTVEREFGNLKLIKDSHPKYVVSMDRMYGQTNVDGIKHVHLRDFLKKSVF